MSNTSTVRVALADSDRWNELTAPDFASVLRIAADDLRAAQQTRARLHAEADEKGSGSVAVFLDVEIHIADDARTARREFATLGAAAVPSSIRYVGTPSGLAGLIADVKAADVADGVTLVPLGQPTRTLSTIADGVVPWLEDRGVAFVPDALVGAGISRSSGSLAS